MHAGQGLALNFGDELTAALMTPYEVMTTEDNGKGFWERVGDDIGGPYILRLKVECIQGHRCSICLQREPNAAAPVSAAKFSRP